jgi:hypothetical protein
MAGNGRVIRRLRVEGIGCRSTACRLAVSPNASPLGLGQWADPGGMALVGVVSVRPLCTVPSYEQWRVGGPANGPSLVLHPAHKFGDHVGGTRASSEYRRPDAAPRRRTLCGQFAATSRRKIGACVGHWKHGERADAASLQQPRTQKLCAVIRHRELPPACL